MSVTPTNVYMNWEPVSFLPDGNGAVAIILPAVKSVKPEAKGELKTYGGGASPGATAQKLTNHTRTVTIGLADMKAVEAIPLGISGTLTATLHDLKNGPLPNGGAMRLTLTNCIRNSGSPAGEHDAIAMNEILFTAVWTQDGNGNWIDPYSFVPITA